MDILDTSGQPPLIMAWDRVITFADLHSQTARLYHVWKSNIVHKHMTYYHLGVALLFNVWQMKSIKQASTNRGEVHQYLYYVSSWVENRIEYFESRYIN